MKLEDVDEMLKCWKLYDDSFNLRGAICEIRRQYLQMFGDSNVDISSVDEILNRLLKITYKLKKEVDKFFTYVVLPHGSVRDIVNEIKYRVSRISAEREWLENHPDCESAMTDSCEDAITSHLRALEKF